MGELSANRISQSTLFRRQLNPLADPLVIWVGNFLQSKELGLNRNIFVFTTMHPNTLHQT